MAAMDGVLDRIDANLPTSLDRLFELLRIESISTDPAYSGQCHAAADWMAAYLTGLGISSSVRQTDGQPMVVGHSTPGGSAPGHVLFYGHYDVQPVDPLELWDTEPFDPKIITRADGSKCIAARGAADDKGQLMTFVEACRAWIEETGGLPVDVSFLLEGEEESGSPSLQPFLEANGEELKADVALVCDTGMWNAKTPAITTMLRGLVGEEIYVTAADIDLHSGMFGGAARNPLHVLATALAALHDDTGRVMVPDFYDGVVEMSDDVLANWQSLGLSAVDFLGSIGLRDLAGEQGRTTLEQIWSRPTCEVNGVIGGYTGDGFKTVIPAMASAKISFRLVGNQDPHAIRANFRELIKRHIPDDCQVEFKEHGTAPALQLPLDSPTLVKGRKALEAEWGVPAAVIGCGGSIPIVGEFKRFLGMDSLLVGFGLDDDRVHSPNEKYEMTSFHGGIRSWARILGELAG